MDMFVLGRINVVHRLFDRLGSFLPNPLNKFINCAIIIFMEVPVHDICRDPEEIA